MAQSAPRSKRSARRIAVMIMLAAAMGGALAVPLYARPLPKLGEFPFFYWYQLILVPVVAILCWLCNLLLRTNPDPAAKPRHRRGWPL